MKPLPLIVGFGGINSAGRSSFHHSYKRIIYDSLDNHEKKTTIGGNRFEDAVIDFIIKNCSGGVITEAVGNVAGVIPHSKKGDLLITMGSDAVGAGRKIVVEIKNKQILQEIKKSERVRKEDSKYVRK